MQCVPYDGVEDAEWVSASIINSPTSVKGLIALCDLSQETSIAKEEL